METAIGLTFVFLLVSVLVTAASEMVANALQLRARCLRCGVEAMLSRGSGARGGLAAQIFQHPLVMGGAAASQGAGGKPRGSTSGPSYIPSTMFVSALFETLGLTRPSLGEWQGKLLARLAALPATSTDLAPVEAAVGGIIEELTAALDGANLRNDLEKIATALGQPSAEVGSLREQLAGVNSRISNGALNWVKPTLSEITKSPTAKDLMDLIREIPTTRQGGAALQDRLQAWLDKLAESPKGYGLALEGAKALAGGFGAADMRAALERLPADEVRRTLLMLFDEAEGDAVVFKVKVAAWFDASMDRVSGWYKRRTAVVNLLIGAVLAVVLKVDALLVLRRLATDPGLRTALVNQASDYNVAKTDGAEGAVQAPATQSQTPKPEAAQDFQATRKQLEELSLPIGWLPPDSPDASSSRAKADGQVHPDISKLVCFDPKTWGQLTGIVIFHGIGWLLTAIAASLGAPFWFDLLNKFMNIRHAGKRPEPVTPAAT